MEPLPIFALGIWKAAVAPGRHDIASTLNELASQRMLEFGWHVAPVLDFPQRISSEFSPPMLPETCEGTNTPIGSRPRAHVPRAEQRLLPFQDDLIIVALIVDDYDSRASWLQLDVFHIYLGVNFVLRSDLPSGLGR